MKKKTRYYSVICLAIALVMCLVQLVSAIAEAGPVGAASDAGSAQGKQTSVTTTVQDEGVVRPEDIDEGLSLKSLKDIRGRRVTVRQPVMEVTDYNVARPKDVPVLEDTYVLGDFETREVLHKDAKVTFEGTEGDPKSSNPKYPMKGLENSSKESGAEQRYFTRFEKYMLLRQAYYFNTHAMEIVKEGHLVKHPAADYIYGAIPDNAPAVAMHIVTDPIYRSPMTTGLYLVPGEKATVTVRGLKEGETLTLYTHHQDTLGYRGYDEQNRDLGTTEAYFAYWDEKILAIAEEAEEKNETPDFSSLSYGLQGQWVWQNQKVPCMGTTYTIKGDGSPEQIVEIGSMYGGPLYMQPTASSVDFTVSGAVLTPHFVLGVTTVKDFNEHYRNAPGLIATMDCENGQLIGPAEGMREADDIEMLGYFWHSVFAIDISLNGREYNYNMTMCYDMHVPAGEAVALNSNFCAQPTYWFGTCMNYKKLTTNGNWGTLHELGHVQAKTYGVNWGFCDGDGEVWNNTLILLIYSLLCNMDTRLDYVEHGEFVHPYTAVVRSQQVTTSYTKDNQTFEITDYGDINNGKGAHFDQLSMYATLLHSFGPEKFIDMFYTYKLDPAYCGDKRADFVYRIALVDRVNILDWVNKNYFANIEDSDFSASQLAFLRSLPTFYPVAYRWANGIDGNETARKYEVDGKHKTVFDLSGDNISSPEKVEILSVSPAAHGRAEYDPKTEKVTYTPPDEVTESDGFDILVSTYGGRQVTLNVRFKLLYRGVQTEVWSLGTRDENLLKNLQPSVAQAANYVQEKEPTSTEIGSVPGKGDFDHPNLLEYFRMRFKFKATESGVHTFYLRADDAAKVQFFKNQDQPNGTPTKTLSTTSVYQFSEDSRYKCEIDLQKGDTVYILAELVNWGGKGNLHIGLRKPGDNSETVGDIPVENIVLSDVTEDELKAADALTGWQPRFVDSIKNVTMDRKAETGKWTVLAAPENEGVDGKENLIDGDESTIYHSHYSGGKKPSVPHVFVFDAGEEGKFNFFEVVRRANANANDKLLDYALYGCKASEYHDGMNGSDTEGWTELFNGAPADANAARQRIVFPEQTFRYFKFIVKDNSAHTVIREIYAGLQTELNQTVRPRAYETENGMKGFEENSANGKLTAKETGASFEFSFLGSGFEVYADTDPSFGAARVTIDGDEAGKIDLSEEKSFHRCVYRSDPLELGTHTVKIVTTDGKPFNISFLNVVYGTPVDEEDYPALKKADGVTEDFGDENVTRLFTREWRTYVSDYKSLTSIKFLNAIPAEGYRDTYRRIDTYIRIYRGDTDPTRIAFVYPGKIAAPTECGSLFAGCEKLTEIDLTNFDTSSLRGATSMFNGCTSLVRINLEGFRTENVQSMGSMFANCVKLYMLDLSGFKLAENANIRGIFDRCVSLYQIKLPETFATEAVTVLPGIYRDGESDTYTYTLSNAYAGHTLTLHDDHNFEDGERQEKVLPGCTTEGSRASCKCTICKFEFDPETEYELLTENNRTIPAVGHDSEWVSGKWPTCTEDGESYQLVCSVCGEVLERGDPMPALGHYLSVDTSKGDGKGYDFVCNGDGTGTLTVYFKCISFDFNHDNAPCEHTEAVAVTINSVEHTDATCTTDATYTFRTAVDLSMVEAVLNPAGKATPDTITDYTTVTIDKTVTLEGSFGHKYGEPVFHWTDNYTKATATFTCSRESCAADAEGHTLTVNAEMTEFDRVEATCLANAYTRYTATARAAEGGTDYIDTQISEEPDTQKQHDYSGVYLQTENGMHRCRCVNGCEQYGEAEACVAQPSWRLTEDRTQHYRLCVCGRHMEEGEHGFEVRLTWPDTPEEAGKITVAALVCPDCGETVHGDASVHIKEGGTKASCEQGGSVVYTVTAEYGGKTFTADSEPYVVGKLGHDYIPAEEPLTWTEEGHYATATLHLVCQNCAAGEPNHTKEILLPAAVQADSSAVCGGYADASVYTVDPKEENILNTVRIALGGDRFDEEALKAVTALSYRAARSQVCHIWRLIGGALEWSVSEDKNEATLKETFECERCKTKITITFKGECEIVGATCEQAEQILFTVTEKSVDEVKSAASAANPEVDFYGDDIFDAIPRREQSITGREKLGHMLYDVDEVPATCSHEGTAAGKRCSRCDYTEGLDVIPAKEHTRQAIPDREPTCTTSGARGGVMCTVCGETLVPQSEIPALGHEEHINDDQRAATCTEAGRTASVSCTRCHQLVRESEPIPAKGHTEHTNEDGKAPTCTEAGWTDSVTCSECGETVHASEPIPAKGHTWETVEGRPATATESGLTDGEQCSECGEVRIPQTEIPPLGEPKGLATGAIVGIVLGSAAAIGIGFAVFFLLKKRRI